MKPHYPGPIIDGDPRILFANPTGTVPGGLNPKSIRAGWHGSGVFQFVAPNSYPIEIGPQFGIAARAMWATPVFDLMPWLGGSEGYSPENSVPIDRSPSMGAGAYLTLQINGISLAGVDLEAYTMEAGHPENPLAIQILANRRDVTPDFWDINPAVGSVALTWVPPANPIRFWQVIFTLDQVLAGAPQALSWSAGMH